MDLSTPMFALATATTVAFVYLSTAFAGVPGGDSGELLAEACQLGVAHPPGYPSFVYFMRATIELLPRMLSPAQRANVGCCALGVVTVTLLYAVIGRTSRMVLKAGIANEEAIDGGIVDLCSSVFAILAALSPHIWLYSIGAEVFVLNNLFVAALLLSCALYSEGVVHRVSKPASELRTFVSTWTTFGAFLCGLSLTNQHTSILLIAPIVAWIGASQLPLLTPLMALQYACAFFSGLLPYANLPIAHIWWRGPGSWGDTSTLQGFLRHLLRQDYGTFRLISRTEGHAEGFWARTGIYLKDLATQQMPPGVVAFLLIGMGAALVTARRSFHVYRCAAKQSAATRSGPAVSLARRLPESLKARA